tara:strand:- start:77 stop:244 length:168 start_codon:yes stop_codon:yes gene_type:complete
LHIPALCNIDSIPSGTGKKYYANEGTEEIIRSQSSLFYVVEKAEVIDSATVKKSE